MQATQVAETSDKRPPGRPPGHPKTGGRQKGSKNRVPAELRQFVDQRGRPLEFLAAIARGAKVSAADPDDPSQKIRVYPSVAERMAASRVLLDRIMPSLKAIELSADPDTKAEPVSKFDLARMIAFSLSQGIQAQEAEAKIVEHEWRAPVSTEPAPSQGHHTPQPRTKDALTDTAVEPEPAKSPDASSGRLPGGFAPAIGDEEQYHGLVLRFEEHLSGGRQRWSVRDSEGRFLATAVGRDRAQAKALELGGIS